jgi:23S rRNA pseudouridine1911/1915/1917 synthase
MSEQSQVVVTPEFAGVRVDRALSSLTGLSRTTVRRLIDAGVVTRQGRAISRADKFDAGAVLVLPMPGEPDGLAPEPVAFDVAFESPTVIVVDKPAGLVVHPGAGHQTGTLVNGLVSRFPELLTMGEEFRWGLVHRLDRDTSGLLLVARDPETHRYLQSELEQRRVGRTYVTLVHGTLESATGTIDAPIGRDPHRPIRMAVIREGRPARTHYRRLAEWPGHTLIEVHLASIGHGVVGDPTYGKRAGGRGAAAAGRIWLHARRLTFVLPDGSQQVVESELPADLATSLGSFGEPTMGSIEF